jgi:hypothetical protein
VEHFHRRLKNALWTRADTADWCNHLQWVMLGILAAFHEDSDFSHAKSMFGSQLVLPGQFVDTAESPSSSFLVQTTNGQIGHSNGQAVPVLPDNVRQCPQDVQLHPATILVPHPHFTHKQLNLLARPCPPVATRITVARANPFSSITAADCARALSTSWIS